MCVQNWKSVALPVPEIIGGTQKIWTVPGYAHAPFSSIFNGLLFGWAPWMFRPNLKSVYSFTRSWDNSDWSFGWGLRTPNLGEEEAVGSRGALMTSYRPSIVTFRLSLLYAFQRYCQWRFCAPARHFSHPTSSLPKIPHVPLELGGWLSGYEERKGVTLIVRAILGLVPKLSNLWSWFHQRYRRTDGQTTCNRNTALCTEVHRAVKTDENKIW